MSRPKRNHGGRPVTTGRGHDGERVNVRLSADEAATLREAADKAGLTPAEMLRKLIDLIARTPARR